MALSPWLRGVWLPLITPFRDGALDETSLRRLIRHYLAFPIQGVILAATTGEGLTLDDAETERLIAIVAEEVSDRLPICLGLSGSDTLITAEMANEKVQVYGDVAILSYNYIASIKNKDGKVSPAMAKSTRVYVKQGGQWMLVHANFAPVTAPN